jgi:hypothetical protein
VQRIHGWIVLIVCAAFFAGCAEVEEDPSKRPGFVDTSDPSKALQTMTPPPAGPAGAAKKP